MILLTAAVAPGVALLASSAWAGWPEVLDTPAHVPVAAAHRRRRARRRHWCAAGLAAVVFLGVVGYGMAGLFVIQGAPDLALTQVTIETLSTVLFVLVLRRLPDRVRAPARRRRPALSASPSPARVGAMVFAFALVAVGQPHRPGRLARRWSSGRCPTAAAATSST